VSGALAERVFVTKLTNVGFDEVAVLERRPFALADVAIYPLFTDDLIELMRRLIPADAQAEVAVAVTLTAEVPTTSVDCRMPV
jgi:arsenite methyltransferase